MDIDTIKKTVILKDTPSETDAFGSQGHQRIAKALAKIIEELSNKDCAIGLEGQWGSGKSTVVKIAETLLNNSKKKHGYQFFTFDLWEHQTENFRRSFLEEFINWLENKNDLISNSVLQDEKDKVRGKTRIITTVNHKEYNWAAIIMIIFIPVAPIIYESLKNLFFSKQADFPDYALPIMSGAFYIALIFYTFLGIKIIHDLFLYKAKDWSNKDLKGLERAKFILSKNVSIYSKSCEKEGTSQTIREIDPTSIEFHEVFRKILGEIQNNSKYKIIFILDNIDRVSKKQALSIWSEIRSLYTNKAGTNNSSHVTLIVPYDKTYIKSAFLEQSSNKTIKHNTPQESSDTIKDTDIINKTFDISIRVSPPIITDWKIFLEKKLDDAFSPNIDATKKYNLFNILKTYLAINNYNVTPRRIISYINEIIPLWMQWHDKISIESIALYTLLSTEIEKNPKSLLNNQLVNLKYQRFITSEDWHKDFAVLFYNVTPDIVNQVYLLKPIVNALSSTTDSTLKDYLSIPGFSTTIMEAIEEAVGDGQESNILSVISNNLDSTELPDEMQTCIWKEMSSKIASIGNIQQDTSGLIKIIKHQDKSTVINKATELVQKITNSIYNNSPYIIDDINSAKIWGECISGLKDIVSEKFDSDKADDFIAELPAPNHAGFLKNLAYMCGKEKYSFDFSEIKLGVDISAIISLFAVQKDLRPEAAAQNFLGVIPQIERLLDENDDFRIKLLNQLNDYMTIEKITNKDDVAAAIEAYAEIYAGAKKESALKQTLLNLANNGALYLYANQLVPTEHQEAIGAAQWLLVSAFGSNSSDLRFKNNPVSPYWGAFSDATAWTISSMSMQTFGDPQIKKIAHLVSKSSSFIKWTGYLNSQEFKDFFAAVIKECVLSKKIGNSLEIMALIKKYTKIKEAIGSDLSITLLEIFAEWYDYFKKNITEENITEIPDEFIVDIYKLPPEIGNYYEHIKAIINSMLLSQKTEDWEKHMSEETPTLGLLITMREIDENFHLLEDNYKPALLKHVIKVLKGEITPNKYLNDWKLVIEALPERAREALAKDIMLTIKNQAIETKGYENLIIVYKDILKFIPYENYPDDSLNSIFLNIINSDNVELINFIDANTEIIKKCHNKATNNTKERVAERIKNIEETGSDAQKDRISKLKQNLAIKEIHKKKDGGTKGQE